MPDLMAVAGNTYSVAAVNPASFRARNPGDYYYVIHSMFSLCAIKILILIGVLQSGDLN
jgi:hypothetical protein